MVNHTAGTVLTAAKDTITEKLGNIKSAYESHGGGIKGAAFAAMEGVKGYYTAGYSFLNNLTGGKLDEMKGKFTSKLSEIGTSVSNGFNTVKTTAGNLMSQAVTNVKGNLDSMKNAYTEAGGGIKGISAAAFTAVKNTASTYMSALNTLTGGKLDSIKSAFSNKLGEAKAAALSKFDEIKTGIQGKIDGAKTVIQNGLNAIKNFFSNCKLELPSIKVPHFNISGGEAPWGIAGKGTAPKVSVDWYKDGGILTGATIFGANGSSLLGGGEAGKEAVLPLSELWSNMKTVVSDVINSQTGASDMYDKIGALTGSQTATGATGESITKELYNNVTNNSTVTKTSERNSSDNSSKIVYSPNVVIQGNASKEDVQEALDMSQEKFNQYMAEYKRQNARTSFA
jgi:hypothetical protein